MMVKAQLEMMNSQEVPREENLMDVNLTTCYSKATGKTVTRG
jgi:hypothetical protein